MAEVQLTCEFCAFYINDESNVMPVCGCDKSVRWGDWVDTEDSCDEWIIAGI